MQQIQWQETWPWTVTLSLYNWAMGSAHQLTERNIWEMFNENLTKDWRDMELTQNSRVNPMTLKCDLDLGSA